MEYLYYLQYLENSVWRDIFSNHIMPKYEIEEYNGLSRAKDDYGGRYTHELRSYTVKDKYCMKHYYKNAQFECLKCGSYALLCCECANDKSNVHHCHPKLFLHKPRPLPIPKYIYCINHPNKKARSVCLSCQRNIFLCQECSANTSNFHYHHERTEFNHDLIIIKK